MVSKADWCLGAISAPPFGSLLQSADLDPRAGNVRGARPCMDAPVQNLTIGDRSA